MTLDYLRDYNHPDYKSGIRAIASKVLNCPVCNRLTNLMYDTGRSTIKLACCKAHAK